MKYLPLLAIACAAALAGCEYKHETTVQPTPATSAVVTPAPGTATVTTTTPPPPGSTTTVYTR